MYSEAEIKEIVDKQREYFLSGQTLDIGWRIARLKELRDALKNNTTLLENALAEDLGRCAEEAYLCDIGPSIVEINEMIHGLKKWSAAEVHFSGLIGFPSVITKVHKMPYGVTLIISPFNFPILLSVGALSAAIAGGNTVVLKASSKSPACTSALKKLLGDIYPAEYVTVIDGGHDAADMCLDQRFDKIFYTGSPKVAKHILEKASKNLTPVALELGGETGNWCIVRADADIKDAARKIAFFKACNSGQICININQIAVAEEIAEPFIEELKKAFINQLGERPETSSEYPHMITLAAFDKCSAEAEKYRDKIVFGGVGDAQSLKYCPTIIYPVNIDDEIVNHELFNPLLPIVPFKDCEIDNIMDAIARREHPLAMYLFTADKRWAEKVMKTQQYGGGCINEVCIHLMIKGVPFNGTGHSGMGAYHGEWGFREFTHPSTVLYGSTKFNLPLREHPYSGRKNAWKYALMKKLEK